MGGLSVDVISYSVFIKVSHTKKVSGFTDLLTLSSEQAKKCAGQEFACLCIFFAPTQNNIL